MSTFLSVDNKGRIPKVQSRETGNTRRRKTKQKHNTTQYMLDATMRKQTQIK